jgi:hypothetical protein
MLGEARGAWMALATMADTTRSGVQRTNSTLDGASTKCPSAVIYILISMTYVFAVLFSLARQFPCEINNSRGSLCARSSAQQIGRVYVAFFEPDESTESIMQATRASLVQAGGQLGARPPIDASH